MAELADMGREEFVSLTSYRRSGVAVSVAVWIAASADDDGALLITTTRRSGKVKRIRHDPRIQLRPCARRGEVAPDAPTVSASAEIVEDPAEVRRLRDAIRAKYGSRMKLTAADADADADADAGTDTADEDEPTRVILRVTERTPDD